MAGRGTGVSASGIGSETYSTRARSTWSEYHRGERNNFTSHSLTSDLRKRFDRFESAEVEYFLSDVRVWTDKARLSLNNRRTKIYLDLEGEKSSPKKFGRSLSVSSITSVSSWTGKRKAKTYRQKINLGSHLFVKHASIISWNFHVVFGNHRTLNEEPIQHKVAFYSESEAISFVHTIIAKGGLQITQDLIESGAPTILSPVTRRIHAKKNPRPISESFVQLEKVEEEMTIPGSSSKILRRKSTGSSDASRSTIGTFPPRSFTGSNKRFQRKRLWYDEEQANEEFYNDSELSELDSKLRVQKQSQNSLESEQTSSDNESDTSTTSEELLRTNEHYEEHSEDMIDGIKKTISRRQFFASAPSLSQQKNKMENLTPQRTKTNEKLEKYKFMLVNIEQDPDIIDPGLFGADPDLSYYQFQFNDYPSEVFYPANLRTEREKTDDCRCSRQSLHEAGTEVLTTESTRTKSLELLRTAFDETLVATGEPRHDEETPDDSHAQIFDDKREEKESGSSEKEISTHVQTISI